MSEYVYQQVEDAIKRKLHVGRGYHGLGYKYCYPVEISEGNIVVRDSDCGTAKRAWTMTTDQWVAAVDNHGLWKQVGFWSFIQADDPDADLIRAANQNPEWAGREIARLRRAVREP